MAVWEGAIERYLDIWNGHHRVEELDGIVTEDYRGHMGSRDRSVEELKADIVAYRQRAKDVRFEVMHRFSDGEYVATRVVARANDAATGAPLIACGLNISRWEHDRLAEEWAVWEPLAEAA